MTWRPHLWNLVATTRNDDEAGVTGTSVSVPAFLLRKLYRRGSLRETGDRRFAFTIQNPLAPATLTGVPRVTVNGIAYEATDIEALDSEQGIVDLASVSTDAPWMFRRGGELDLSLEGHLLRGGNRLLIEVPTKEFGTIEIFVEDRIADSCELPLEDGEDAEE